MNYVNPKNKVKFQINFWIKWYWTWEEVTLKEGLSYNLWYKYRIEIEKRLG